MNSDDVDASPLESRIVSDEIANESVLSEQSELYGEIKPAPKKRQEPKCLPELSNKLVIPKRRQGKNTDHKKDVSLTDFHGSHKIPMKSRNFTSPLPKRVPSLGTSPIPDLSPSGSRVKNRLKAKYGNILSNRTTPIGSSSPLTLRSFSSPPAELRSNKIPLQVRLNQISKSTYVGESDRQLKREILKYRTILDKLAKIKQRREHKTVDDVDRLVDKWRNTAIAASNYMLNEARLKINKIGGIEEYRRKQQVSKLRKLKFQYDNNMLSEIEDYMKSDVYKVLDKYEKEQVRDRKKEIEKISEGIESGDYPGSDKQQNNDNEFSMRELYAQLHLDYEIVYPDTT
ncbi:hypothetical protein FOA43_002263 [Brettanomyces nanus]|uniref:Meiosis protein 5 n=1 Tax=Eeniella nana TaxID=13502 RepID=A0A875S3H7_EENNA|nr:uncharacterized protein FOA43_002263 [Brettanomyces nanus]QPG74925.1 hypothetical protein FOA43_002263 [Brettanomyces nanus]